jgi:hypothetical protein
MDFTKSLIKSKNPCTDGFRWYLRHHKDGSDYQQVLDDLVRDGRVEDACWLLDQLGPTHTLLELDDLEADDFVHAGSILVRGSIEVRSLLRVGGSIRCGGTIRAGEDVVAGDGLRVDGGLNCEGNLRSGAGVVSGWHVIVGGCVDAGELKVDGDASVGRVTGRPSHPLPHRHARRNPSLSRRCWNRRPRLMPRS